MTQPAAPRPAPVAPAEEQPVRGWRIGRLAGIPVYLGYSWPLVGLVVIAFVGPSLSRTRPDLGSTAYVVGAGLAVMLLVSVLVHEAAHALVGRAVGYRVTRVVADFWGGHTAYSTEGMRPGNSALVAVVGPLANAAIGLVGWLVLLALDPGPGIPLALLTATVWANLFVAAFNLLPGLPLDGGFLVQALVWRISGSRSLGMVAAGWAGRLLAIGAVTVLLGVPLLQGRPVAPTSVIWALLIVGFLWFGASSSITVGRNRRVLERIPAEQHLRPVVLAPLDLPLARVRSRIPPEQAHRVVVVVLDARLHPIGTLDVDAMRAVPPDQRDVVPVSAVMRARPPGWIIPAGEDASLTPVVIAMQTHRTDAVLLLDAAGAPRGVVVAGDL